MPLASVHRNPNHCLNKRSPGASCMLSWTFQATFTHTNTCTRVPLFRLCLYATHMHLNFCDIITLRTAAPRPGAFGSYDMFRLAHLSKFFQCSGNVCYPFNTAETDQEAGAAQGWVFSKRSVQSFGSTSDEHKANKLSEKPSMYAIKFPQGERSPRGIHTIARLIWHYPKIMGVGSKCRPRKISRLQPLPFPQANNSNYSQLNAFSTVSVVSRFF